MGFWSMLPLDLLNAVEDNVTLYIDKIRLRAVCESWNSYLPKLPAAHQHVIPLLLHPLQNSEEATHGLFNPIDNNDYKIYLPEAQGKIFRGSSYGWIVTVEDINSTNPNYICLINPITRAQIKLPQRTEFDDVVRYQPDQIGHEFIIRSDYDMPADYHFVEGYVDEMAIRQYSMNISMMEKVLLSSAPSDDECLVVCIYGQANQLSWCRIGDKRWTHIYMALYEFIEIVFFKGKLYAMTDRGEVFVIENIGTNIEHKVTKLVETDVPILRGRCAYLAECSDGSLIVVGREFLVDEKLIQTTGFKVFKLQQENSNSNSNWIEVNDLGGGIFFVGFSSALVSSDLTGGYKRNHIYFTDSASVFATPEENENLDADIGVFNLQDGALESFPDLDQPNWPRPIWVNIGY